MAAPSGIVTPEAVLLELSEAGLASRALAFAIDLAVRGGLAYGALPFIGVLSGFSTTVAIVLGFALTLTLTIVYPVAFETLNGGRTPGKAALGLRVVTLEGGPVRFRHAMVRALIGFVELWASAGSLAIVTTLVNQRSQRLGDIAAGTVVVNDQQAGGDGGARRFHALPGWESFAASVDVSAIRPEQYAVIRSFLMRCGQLTEAARQARADELGRKVAALVHQQPADPTALVWVGSARVSAYEPFLVAVAAAYQARSPVPKVAWWALAKVSARGVEPNPVEGGWREDLAPGWGLPASRWSGAGPATGGRIARRRR